MNITFEQVWNYGGPLMWVLSLFSVAALAVAIYLWYSQRKGVFLPDAMARMEKAKDKAAEGGRIAARCSECSRRSAESRLMSPPERNR